MKPVIWRIVGMVALGIGGLVVALALTLGALALAGEDLDGGDVPPGIELSERPSASATPSRDDRTHTPSPSRSPTAPSPDDHGSGGGGSDDDSGPGSDDHGGDDDSSGPGSGGDDDSSGPGSGGGDDHSDDDD